MFSDTIDLKGCTKDGFVLIKNHGLIASNRTAALVGANGDIDWACLPKFDSDPILAGILDSEKGGHFIITPNYISDLRVYQNYREMTNILVTEHLILGTIELLSLKELPDNNFSQFPVSKLSIILVFFFMNKEAHDR